jgi:hypothetical protein
MSNYDLALLLLRVLVVPENPRQRIGNTVIASSNETPCFEKLAFALFGSHSNLTDILGKY